MVKESNRRLGFGIVFLSCLLQHSDFVPVSLGPSSITVLHWSDLNRRHRERQRREFTLFHETRLSSAPNSLEEPIVQCTATNLNCIGKKRRGSHLPSIPKRAWVGKAMHCSTDTGVLSPHPIRAYLNLWERGQEAGGGSTVIAAGFPSALLLCSWGCGEQEGRAIAGALQRAEQSSTEPCPPPAFVCSPLSHFHEQDNAKSCCAYAHWGWGLKSETLHRAVLARKENFQFHLSSKNFPACLEESVYRSMHSTYTPVCLLVQRECAGKDVGFVGKGEVKHQYVFIIMSLKGTNLD